MSDLIDRNAVMLRVREFIGNPTYDEIMLVNDLNALPSAEPERTVNVKRVSYDETMIYETDGECECGKCVDALWDYCPSCGAKLKWGKK